jgi:hypothetical protein
MPRTLLSTISLAISLFSMSAVPAQEPQKPGFFKDFSGTFWSAAGLLATTVR